ncbi:hypothetical protein [Amycolatopsis sp. WQ 127309]|uniref:hypothetical protein n=1 Tax=Amycolatopsis sp. WQ 127309 TaxID=2932773 RepID=UPI001FF0FCA4|nr:hypothetical protein [Amycolatopsis sp. WQ 127309]UOZ11345.1 hypothetical protein MUY22_24985 [Amycolatopsis sp. WQ 127309]
MNEELITAVERLRLMPQGRQWFIPVLLGPCALPELAVGPGRTLDEQIHHVDLSADWAAGMSLLLRSLGSARIS